MDLHPDRGVSFMAKHVLTQLVDDLDGGPADVANFRFAVDGKQYEIDLSNENVIRFEEAIDPFVTAARGVHKAASPKQSSNGRRPAGVDRAQIRAIREWGQKRFPGQVADRGRISADVVEAYEKEAGRS
jgi:hypothetical protein